jgi:creatinine amidohydrolase
MSDRDREVQLARLTRQDVLARAAEGAIGLLPVGSIEQHGDHLPLGTDTLLVEAICLIAAENTSRDVLVAPPLWTGFSPHHLRFGATVTLATDTFTALVRETAGSLSRWLSTVVVVNGHGGNRGALRALELDSGLLVVTYWELPEAAARALEAFPDDHGSIGHAGQAETSMMLALDRRLVGEPATGFEPCPPSDPLYAPELGDTGVIGNPASASERAGANFLESTGQALAAYLERLPNERSV